MDETRAMAKLPGLDIEVTLRRLADEEAEQLTISLRAVPSFDTVARLFETHPAWPWLALAPLVVWQQAMAAFWVAPYASCPWLAPGRGLATSDRAAAVQAERQDTADRNVHPFPGPGARDA